MDRSEQTGERVRVSNNDIIIELSNCRCGLAESERVTLALRAQQVRADSYVSDRFSLFRSLESETNLSSSFSV